MLSVDTNTVGRVIRSLCNIMGGLYRVQLASHLASMAMGTCRVTRCLRTVLPLHRVCPIMHHHMFGLMRCVLVGFLRWHKLLCRFLRHFRGIFQAGMEKHPFSSPPHKFCMSDIRNHFICPVFCFPPHPPLTN